MPRKLRIPLVVVLVALAGSIGGSRASRAECPSPEAMERTIPSVAAVRVHEWGVWRIDAGGHVISIEDLARETPAFVHRATDVPNIDLGPTELLVPCEKPVVYFHAAQPLDVVMNVGFARGTPWLHYPNAEAGRFDGVPSLRWSLRVDAESTRSTAVEDIPLVHWWSTLRAPSASEVVAPSGERERFAFYDGATSIEPFYRVGRRGVIETIPGRRPSLAAWTYDGRIAAQLDIHGRRTSETRYPDVAALRAEVKRIVMARGLFADEAEAMLTTWNAELFTGNARRIVYVLADDVYAAMLPLTIRPMPAEIRRVGLVIQRL